ncbi:MAG TPA: VOC family protein [Roseiarcus sp.]|nr:VOC family protein [Roseiarcus sp.]
MKAPDFLLLYVDNPPASAAFYEKLLARAPVENSVNFSMFVLDSGLKLGFWRTDAVEPKPTARPGGAEIVFALDGAEAVDALCADWRKKGLPIAQEPTAMDFGYTFVALDPDGHRLRACALA